MSMLHGESAKDQVTFKNPDGPFTGFFVFFLGWGILTLPLWMTESDFLATRVRRGGGILKLIEQTIGWTTFSVLMMLLGVWCITLGFAALWKLFNRQPDLRAQSDKIEFHPALRRKSAKYNDIDYWTLHFASGHPVVTIYFVEKFWSLQSMWPRRSMVLEGGREDLEGLVEFFLHHPYMSMRFRR